MKLAIDIHATQAQIAEIDKRIQEKRDAIKLLEKEIKELSSQRDKLKSSLTDVEYYKKVESFLANAEHIEMHYLDRQTSTRDMMTDLRRGSHSSDTSTKGNGKPIDYFILDDRFVLLYPLNHDIPSVATSGSITATAYKTSYGLLTMPPFTGIIIKLKNGQQVAYTAEQNHLDRRN